jgi:hypothetical protein
MEIGDVSPIARPSDPLRQTNTGQRGTLGVDPGGLEDRNRTVRFRCEQLQFGATQDDPLHAGTDQAVDHFAVEVEGFRADRAPPVPDLPGGRDRTAVPVGSTELSTAR